LEKAPARGRGHRGGTARPAAGASSGFETVWDQRGSSSHQCLALRDVRAWVRLGAFAEERAGPQPVSVDVELYRRHGAFTGGGLADCLDYDRVFRHLVETWPERPHTELLEQLAEDLVQFCLADARVEACRVVIRKQAIYAGRAVPEITVYRCRTG
jgi:dihydroneopterin aldolase